MWPDVSQIKYLIICGISGLFVAGAAAHNVVAQNQCERIVSLAPSVTETLYELGLGSSVVGVTKFDVFPAEVKTKTIIGGFLDPNIELIAQLAPSIIIGLSEHASVLERFEKLNIKTTIVDHRSVEDILKSFRDISQICGQASQGERVASEIRSYLNSVKESVSNKSIKRKVAVVVSRNYDSADLKEVYLSGLDGYYDTLLSYAGAENVFQKQYGSISAVSVEGLYALNPDYIIEVLPSGYLKQYSEQKLRAPWQKMRLLRAAKEGNIYFIDDDWATIPGPRMTKILDRFVQILYE